MKWPCTVLLAIHRSGGRLTEVYTDPILQVK